MSWLRIDDNFTANAKISELTDAQLRVWLRTLCYCARANDPSVDSVTIREVSGLTSTRCRTFATLRLLDKIGEAHEVHDWLTYRPKDTTNADRQARWRARQRVTTTVTVDVTAPVTKPSHPLAGTRGKPPHPSCPEEFLEAQALLDQDAGSVRAGAIEHQPLDREALTMSDPVHRLLTILPDAHADTEQVLRAITTSEYAFDQARDECQRVGGKTGLAVTILRRIASGQPAFDVDLRDMGQNGNGSDPTTPSAVLPLMTILAAWITFAGHTDHWAGVEREIADCERRRGETLTDEQRDVLRERWQALQPDEPEPP